MIRRVFFLFLVVILVNSIEGYSQNLNDSTRIHRIEMKDGNAFTGVIISEDSLILVLKTENLGEIKIHKVDIMSRTEISKIKKVDGRYWLPNPQSARYFWAPNGYGLKKGESYYQNIWVLYNQMSFGLTNNFSIGAGTVPLFLFSSEFTPIWIVPKFSFPIVENKFNVGTGAFLGTVVGAETGIFGLLYGTTTFGSRDKNVSLGLAYGFAQDQWMHRPIINLSSMIRIAPKGYFITENYVIPAEKGSTVLISLGGRSIIRNLSLDYSLWLPFIPDMDTFIAIPFLGVTIPIGKKK
jgi:hypothetical protein